MTLAELFVEFNAGITATADEIAAWNTLDPVQIEEEVAKLMSDRLSAAADNTVATRVGLFGADLTDFNADCVALEDDCDVADYADYNGWGVGICWEPSTEDNEDQYDGVVFTDSKWVTQIYWSGSSGTNWLSSGISDVAPAEDAPVTDDVDLEEAKDAFEAWAGDMELTNEDDQFMFAFFEAGDTTFYFEAGDKTSIWATAGVHATVSGNVETADFELVGAASLTAATSIIVAALLF